MFWFKSNRVQPRVQPTVESMETRRLLSGSTGIEDPGVHQHRHGGHEATHVELHHKSSTISSRKSGSDDGANHDKNDDGGVRHNRHGGNDDAANHR